MTNAFYENYAIFNLETGGIDRTLFCAAGDHMMDVGEGEGIDIFHGDQRLMYRDVVADAWADKMPGTLSVNNSSPDVGEEITLSGIPAPCRLWINGREHAFEAGETSTVLVFENPGTHCIALDAAAYLWQEVFINVS